MVFYLLQNMVLFHLEEILKPLDYTYTLLCKYNS